MKMIYKLFIALVKSILKYLMVHHLLCWCQLLLLPSTNTIKINTLPHLKSKSLRRVSLIPWFYCLPMPLMMCLVRKGMKGLLWPSSSLAYPPSPWPSDLIRFSPLKPKLRMNWSRRANPSSGSKLNVCLSCTTARPATFSRISWMPICTGHCAAAGVISTWHPNWKINKSQIRTFFVSQKLQLINFLHNFNWWCWKWGGSWNWVTKL